MPGASKRAEASLLVWLGAIACGGPGPGAPQPAEHPPIRRIKIAAPGLRGLSGLTTDASGRLWTIPEQGGRLVTLTERGTARSVPLGDAPPGLDYESLAFVGDRRFAIGTESTRPDRRVDLILLVEVNGGTARVTGAIELPYDLWRLRARAGAGIEGLCEAGGTLIAASETTQRAGGHRFAPLGRYDPGTGRWVGYRLRLTTRTGKISALDCRLRDGALEVLAVERHFAVSRILQASLPPGTPPGAEIVPRVAANLATGLASKENLEGIARLPDGRLALVVDNSFRHVVGPNELVLLPADLVH